MTTCVEEDPDRFSKKEEPRMISFAGAFLDMASDRVEVTISLPEGRDPIVLDWRIALSRKNRHRLRHRQSSESVSCLRVLLGYVRTFSRFGRGGHDVGWGAHGPCPPSRRRVLQRDVAEQTGFLGGSDVDSRETGSGSWVG